MIPAADQLRRLALGVACAAVVAAVWWVVGGRVAAIAAGVLGLVATAMQIIAAGVVARLGGAGRPDRLMVYGLGMLLRFGGVAVLGALVAFDRSAFPPAASATGYLATVLPLLFLETRAGR